MVEKTLIAIITAVFLLSSWWWSNQQDITEKYFEEQLRARDTAIEQLSTLALLGVQGKTPAQVQELFQTLYSRDDVRYENDVIHAGSFGVRFSDEKIATGFCFPWDFVRETPTL